MKGTEKQIAWAQEIKAAYKHNAELIKNYPGMNPLNIEFIEKIEAYLDSIEDAGAVIDNFKTIKMTDDVAEAFKRIRALMMFSDGVKKIAQSMR